MRKVIKYMVKIPNKQLIKKIFAHNLEIRSAIREARMERPRNKISVPNHAFISNPTENQAIKNVTPLGKITCDDGFTVHHPEQWVEIIDKTKELFPKLVRGEEINDKEIQIIVDKWCEEHSMLRLSTYYGINRTTMYDLRERYFEFATALAAQYGLIDMLAEGRRYDRRDETEEKADENKETCTADGSKEME